MEFSMRFLSILTIFILCSFCCGCISYQYDGKKTSSPTEKVVIYNNKNKLTSKYTLLGTAKVSASYTAVTKEEMIKKLEQEAKNTGANAIVIIDQQVTPTGNTTIESKFATYFETQDNHNHNDYIAQDFNHTYGNVNNRVDSTESINNYTRTIIAQFLKLKESKK
jgi:hypothetical protein